MDFFSMENKCAKCFINFNDGVQFNFLEGNPFVCSRCFAKALGVDVPWKKEIVKKINKTAMN